MLGRQETNVRSEANAAEDAYTISTPQASQFVLFVVPRDNNSNCLDEQKRMQGERQLQMRIII